MAKYRLQLKAWFSARVLIKIAGLNLPDLMKFERSTGELLLQGKNGIGAVPNSPRITILSYLQE